MTPQCKTCEHLIERYGYCQVVEDWVRPAKENWFSFERRRLNEIINKKM